MPSGRHHKRDWRDDRTGATPPEQVPETASRLDYTWPEDDKVSAASLRGEFWEEAIANLILSGEILEAFEIDHSTASNVIAEHAWSSDDPCWEKISPLLPSMLASLLEERGQAAEGQAPAAPPAPEPKPFVRLYLAKTLLAIAQDPQAKSKALDILLSEAVALAEPGRDVVRSVLSSLEPLEVMPNLIRFLREARARGHAAWQVFFDGIDRLIEPGFGVYKDRPADVERFRGELLPLFAELLTDGRLDEWVKEQVVRIVRIRATPLGGGLKAVVAKLGESSGVAAEEVAWRIYAAVLRGHKSNRKNREAATEWAIEHPSKVKEDPSAWRVYVNILCYSREPKYRIKAVRWLGAYGPTSTLHPLPADVAEVQKLLFRLSEGTKDPKLREAAGAALAQNRARGNEAAKLSSSLKLTSHPSLEQTVSVARVDAPQQVSPGPAAALSPDLDLSSCQVTTDNGIHALDLAILPPVQRTHVDQGSQGFTQHVVDASAASSTTPALEPSTDLIVGMIWKTLRDLAAHRPEAIPAILEGSRNFSADFDAGESLAAPVAAANAPEPPVGPLQVPNNSQGSPKTRETNFMSTSEAAQFLEITKGMVRRHCESGKIEGEKLGRDWIVIRESVERFRNNPPKRGRKPKYPGD